ncbi:MAG TPA: hopanoid-associated sugar epimerase [Bryobacteraceae bacterium]|nr:hopanoid-associated sugar epimerase [Bryobacteraceae bacterium]
MSFTLVTGATGFLGWHVARVLTENGHRVRALCRPGSELRELDAEPITGDLRDRASLARAIGGCEFLFHVAADYRLWSRNSDSLYQSNVEGTRNILEAAEREGVKKIVYTSTVGCIGMPEGAIGDESTPVSVQDMIGHYKRSKWLAEEIAIQKARVGLPVVIVNPTAPVGDHDWKPTPTGKIIVDFLHGKLSATLDTGLNIVDAEDVAIGHLLAAQHGRIGERYILGSENLTFEQILGRLAVLSKKKAPRLKIPYAVAYAAGVVTTGLAYVTGKPPRAPLEGVKMARKKMFVTHAKATRELGFSPRPAGTALEKAVKWFSENGYR